MSDRHTWISACVIDLVTYLRRETPWAKSTGGLMDHLRQLEEIIVRHAKNPTLWRRVVKIRCPHCDIEQEAEELFYQSDPFPSYVHECVECKYTIGESEWDYAVGGGGMPPIKTEEGR